MDIIKQGSRARALGRPRDACNYPADSRERRAWYEGYDGSTWDFAERVSHPAVASERRTIRDVAANPTSN